MDKSENTISYFLDTEGIIRKVSGPWDEFANDNDGAGARAEAVIGKSLASFIAGDISNMFVQAMVDSARARGKTVYRPYRCDSGRMKRYMEMTAIPLPDGLVEVRHRLLYTEPVRHFQFVPAQRIASPGAMRIKRCSMCNKVRVASDWYEIDDALRLDLLAPEQAEGPWIFGVCPPCLQRSGVAL